MDKDIGMVAEEGKRQVFSDFWIYIYVFMRNAQL